MTTLLWISFACVIGGLLSVFLAAGLASAAPRSWIPHLVSVAIGAGQFGLLFQCDRGAIDPQRQSIVHAGEHQLPRAGSGNRAGAGCQNGFCGWGL